MNKLALIVLFSGLCLITFSCKKDENNPAQPPSGDRTFNWSGFTWVVKNSGESTVGPGPNYFSNSTNNVWVDNAGELHLKITKNAGKFYCAEVYTTQSVGYGVYAFQLSSRVDNLDKNVVVGLFTWNNNNCPTNANSEVDIEFSKWGDPNNTNVLQYAVQPTNGIVETDRYRRFPIQLNGDYSIHFFNWTANFVSWSSYHGHTNPPPQSNYIADWYFDKNNKTPKSKWECSSNPILIPAPENDTKIDLNLWLAGGNAPSVNEVELIIHQVDFYPASPNTGHFIVFDRNVSGHADIFIANIDGTNIRNLTNDSAEDFHPRLNGANDKILFISDRSGQANVYTMNLDGANVHQVTTRGVSGGQNNVWYRAFADFTSDNKIVYCKGNKLYKINIDGTNDTAIATAPSDNWERVSCSRTGNKIAALTMGSWSYNEKIYIMNPDGSNMQVLVPDNPGGIYLGNFSPDGSKIAYIYDISGHEESSGCQLNNHVFLINIDGTNNTDISGGKVSGTNDYYPTITADGQKVIFSNGPGCGGTTSPNVWIMNINGSNRQQIITDGYVVDTN